jgi:hypothetical protein
LFPLSRRLPAVKPEKNALGAYVTCVETRKLFTYAAVRVSSEREMN